MNLREIAAQAAASCPHVMRNPAVVCVDCLVATARLAITEMAGRPCGPEEIPGLRRAAVAAHVEGHSCLATTLLSIPPPVSVATYSFVIPTKTYSITNERTHHMVKHRWAKEQRKATWGAALAAGVPALRFDQGAHVTMTRVDPFSLDVGDNLPSSMKSVRDQLAVALGVNDGSGRVKWWYEQRVGKGAPPAVEVEIRVVMSATL